MINTSLAAIFTPKTWNTDCLHRALRHELGIPSAAVYASLAALRLHAHIIDQDNNMPARTLYQITKNMLQRHAGRMTEKYLTTRIRTTLNELDKYDDWITFSIPHPRNTVANNNIKKRTITRAWINNLACKLAQQELQKLQTWANNEQNNNHQNTQMSGRAAQYFKITNPDQLQRATTLSLQKSPFQPFPYINMFADSQLVSLLIRIRSQNSIFPTHIPSVSKTINHTSTKYYRIPYGERFCCFCVPFRSEWGLTMPPPSTPLGSEMHILTQCIQTENERNTLDIALNQELRNLVITQDISRNPWFELDNDLRIATLLGCIPPQKWKLSKTRTKQWYNTLEKHLKPTLLKFVIHCHKYHKDLKEVSMYS
jgi:hypothetical protein